MPNNETIGELLHRRAPGLLALEGVVGVAEGEADGRPCVTVYGVRKSAEVLGQIPAVLEGWPVVVRESGEFRALAGAD